MTPIVWLLVVSFVLLLVIDVPIAVAIVSPCGRSHTWSIVSEPRYARRTSLLTHHSETLESRLALETRLPGAESRSFLPKSARRLSYVRLDQPSVGR